MIKQKKENEKNLLFEVLHSYKGYFLPYSFNGNWNDMGAIDVYKLCMLLEELPINYCCGYSFVNEAVWSIIITIERDNIFSNYFKASPNSSFPIDNFNVKTLEIYVTKDEISLLKKIVFYNDNSDFWKNLENN